MASMHLRWRTAFGIATTTAALVLGTGSAHVATPVQAQSSETRAIAFTVSDGSVNGPDTVAPGLETLRIANAGTMPHDLHIVRLNDGVTLAQVLAVAPQGDDNDPQAELAVYALTQFYGGADTLDPGMSQLLTADLPAGNYFAIDLSGMSPVPVLKTFVVSGPPVSAQPLQADFVVAEGEFYFGAPQIAKAGSNIVKITNVGYQVHMMIVARLDAGYTVNDVVRFIATTGGEGEPPDWVHPGPGMVDLSPGLTVYTTLNFEPGMYVLLCFEPDALTSRPHLLLGMLASFTAQ